MVLPQLRLVLTPMSMMVFTVLNQTYQIGNVPRTAPYNLFGPSPVLDLDSGISRTFKITEKVSFVFNANCTN